MFLSRLSGPSGGWRNRQTAYFMAFDEARDEAGRLCLFDKVVKERRASPVFLGRSDRLLNRGEPPLQNPRALQLGQIGEQPRAETGKRLHPVAHELLVVAVESLRPHQRRI